ncbi:MAG TPA: DUF418 domain-containing protein [Chitinophagaceae bacterium]|nr:DUF418 domain-containing protein [Chitinophagaceae bacterium]
MTNQLPIQQQDRTIIVDVLRGFALFGVLLGNFSGMLTNNVPEPVIDAQATAFDWLLDELHNIFIENKFMTLFSILFGYGFGVIMERLEKKSINSTPFFLRRMFWLFIFGCINLALWNGDILHIYALTGIFLLLFRKQSNRKILLYSVFFLFVLPTAIRFYQHFLLNYSINEDAMIREYYQSYKFGSLKQVAITNYKVYPFQWIYTWVEWRDMSETFGRFLLGYYILRRHWLVKLNENIFFIKKIWKWTLLITIVYIPLLVLADKKMIPIPRFSLYPFIKGGVLCMAIFYAATIALIYNKRNASWLMETFRNLGRITLTNYLMQTILYVVIFYHIGFGLLGEISFSIIWLSSFVVYFLQAFFSKWWLSKFYYGPVEWIWRQFTYKKKFPIRKY